MHEEIKVSLLKIDGRDVFYMQYRDPISGRKVKRSTKTTKRGQAERAAANWEKEVRAGLDKRQGRIAWDEFRERYELEAVAGLADKTAKKIAGVLNSLEQLAAVQRLGDVTTDRLQSYVKRLRDLQRAESTIKGNLAHLRAALAWAADIGLIASVPKMPKVQRAKSTKVMKGRPITGEEFDRMLAKVEAGLLLANAEANKRKDAPRRKLSDEARAAYKARQRAAVGPAVASWEFLLRGLHASGLRLGEALSLHWTDGTRLHIDLSCRHPMLRIPAELEKGHKDRLLPLAPEFADLLLATPAERRVGFVFNPRPIRADKLDRLGEQQVGRAITAIGKAANIKTDEKSGKPKWASAHDLRRSFGTRWAARVMPQVLMELMRHESIETTLRYYVGRNAQATAGILWAAVEKETGTQSGTQAATESPIAASIDPREVSSTPRELR